MTRLHYVCMAVLLMACSKGIDTPSETTGKYPLYTLHTIKQGAHYAETNRFEIFRETGVWFSVIFDSSAVYSTLKSENRYDINKLYGFSDCSSAHHANSARFGWRWNGESVDILAYTYVNSIRQTKLLGTASIGEAGEYSLTIDKNVYRFGYKGQVVEMPRYCDTDKVTGYKLFPYFGGDETAPHDISVYIRETAPQVQQNN